MNDEAKDKQAQDAEAEEKPKRRRRARAKSEGEAAEAKAEAGTKRRAARRYDEARSALSYSIFSKCGTSQRSSTE